MNNPLQFTSSAPQPHINTFMQSGGIGIPDQFSTSTYQIPNHNAYQGSAFPPNSQFQAPIPQISPNQFQFQKPIIPTQTVKQPDKQIEKLKEQYEEEIDHLKEIIKKLEIQIHQLKKEILKQKNEFEEESFQQRQGHIDELNKQQDITNNTNQQNQTKIRYLNAEIVDLKEQLQQRETEFNRYRQQILRSTGNNNNNQDLIAQYLSTIDDLRSKNSSLSRQLRERDSKIQNQEYEIEQLKKQLERRNDNKQQIDQSNQNEEHARLIKELSSKLQMLESKVQELDHKAFVEQKKREDREKEIGKLKETVSTQEHQIQLQQIEIDNDKKIIKYIQEETSKNQGGNNSASFIPHFNQELQRLQENTQREIRERNRLEEEKKQNELMRQKEQNEVQRKVKEERDQQAKIEKQKKACKLREAIMNSQGILQVGLLVDVTGSMDEYKDATMNMIQKTMGCIKSQTNRDCEWGAVCYQDFAELKQRGEYMQHHFTKDSNKMISFLKKIVCDGGDDGAEDLRNGVKQMLNNLKWEKYFKIALLICDAPCHGKKWAGKVLDDYPDEDLEDALQLLINKNIVLIGIEFSQNTDVMFAQMKNFYAKQNKQQMLIIVDLKNRKPDQIQDQLINIISEASISITEVNQQGTKTKKENPKRDGAFEALFKLLPDPTKFNLDPKITTIETKFKVFRVEINQKAFERNITTIYKIKIPEDYNVTLESEWSCVRTLKPFAFGQLKEVYLMKKLNSQDEVYVIKMPIGGQTYKTRNEAILECRSHLISKSLMQKFMSDLSDKGFHDIQIRYSDFLILQEHDSSFWIAERFFKGDFVKFNNNYGYINPNNNILNNIAQVFSYYTYHISEFQYLICDVQGVGSNFTDPAINTSEGNLDETDLGQEGIGQYIISFEKDKQTRYQKYLDLLDLKD
ncbi:unnamed protein product (macronuclear) [Paramecium tetraurelia]|uniref:Alpha-type protein kinase domain-containing protein n=1 Tax=Paramecium tetraurelia TaxID=5888 RepID=A0DN80_PARTE|nr:uncharacterized protein GSPATT00018702001 [Paramecium tetraurelia]CAK84497.1 unnamed protein product [Paramecium tetraurelia]|eukprot:XP_001451894.1 hypothetical protein (macronuclear) [Paramecium tetraurelia strain d4-2]